MNMKLKTTVSTLTIAIATSPVAGRGSDHDELPPSNPNPPVTQAMGKAVDFYLAGATVTFEDCGDQTAITDETGGFEYPDNCRDTALTVTGGVDIGTELPFSGTLKAPRTTAGSLNIASPLTTLVAYSDGNTASVAAKLGLTGNNANLLTVDPMTSADLLKQTVVVQQFVDQIQKALVQLSGSAGGGLTAEQAARAASTALAARLEAQTGTVDLTSSAFIQAAVQSAVLEAEDDLDLPAGTNIETLAAKTAALTTAVIQEKVEAVDTAMSNITIGANPQATLNALGAKLETVKETATSSATANLVNTLSTALMSNSVSAADLQALGTAVAAGNLEQIKAALADVNESLPAGDKIPESIADDLQQVDLYKNYLQLVNLRLNNSSTTYDIAAIEGSAVSGNELTTTGPLNNVQVKLNKVGSPFQGNFSEARVGLSYTISGGNTLDLIIDRVNMSFDSNGMLTAAIVPVGATYAFRGTGSPALVGTSRNNLQADNLTVTNGAVSLPIDTFLNKLAGTSGVPTSQVESYRPKAGNNVSIKVALGATSSTTVRVGTGTGNTARAAASIGINTSTNNTLAGQGVSAKLRIAQ